MAEEMQMSHNITNPVWQIFDEEILDLSTVEREYVEYCEQNVSNTKILTKYEIETRDKDSFIEPHMGYLEIKYRLTTDQSNTIAIPLSDKIALQNHGLSLFKNAEYLIEDQRIEYLDDPAIAWTIKNITDFSKQYGESISSAEGFYLDTNDHATLKNCNLRFFNNTAGRCGVELFWNRQSQNTINNLFVTTVAGGTAADTLWRDGDSIVCLLDSNFPTPCAAAGGNTAGGTPLPANFPKQVIFYSVAVATINTKTILNLTITLNGLVNANATANGVLTIASTADFLGIGPAVILAPNQVIKAFVQDTGEDVYFFRLGAIGAVSYTAATGYLDTMIQPISVANQPVNGFLLAVGATPAFQPAIANGDALVGGTINQENYNVGFQKRYLQAIRSAFTGNIPTGQYHSLWIPLKNIFMFCRAYDKISRGLRHRMVFNRNPDNLALLRYGATPNRYFSLEYISCWIPRLKPSLQVLKEIEAKLVSGRDYVVNFTDLTCWHTNLVLAARGTQTAFQLATTTKKPIRIWIAFQLQARYEGEQNTNKRVFDHLNTQAIQVRLNQQLFPLYEYKFDNDPNANYLAKGNLTGVQEFLNYQRAYNALLSAAYKNRDSADGSMITYEQFRDVYPIYYFDLTNQPEELYVSNKYAEIEIRWTNNSEVNYYAWVITESERKIMMKGIAGSLAISL